MEGEYYMKLKSIYYIAIAALALVFSVHSADAQQHNNQQPIYQGLVAPGGGSSGTANRQQAPSGYSGLTSGGQGSSVRGGLLNGGSNPYVKTGNRVMSAAEKKRLEDLRRKQILEGNVMPKKTLEQKFNASPEKLARIKNLRERRARDLQKRQALIAEKRAKAQRAQQFRQSGSIALP
jgi:hypothetical protein